MSEYEQFLNETSYRIWTNDAGTMLVRLWRSGTVEVATRRGSSDTWGVPEVLSEDQSWGRADRRTR